MQNELACEGKRILIVDDDPDVRETLEDLLQMCDVTPASSFDEARQKLETEFFDIAILDIMGVDGYKLLEIAKRKDIVTVMLTAYALTPADVAKSFRKGADYYVPKEEMVNITTFLQDILEAKAEGQSPWRSWYRRLAAFCERKFGPDWQSTEPDFWERFPFH
jgi:CheY-like chemotaxis protein